MSSKAKITIIITGFVFILLFTVGIYFFLSYNIDKYVASNQKGTDTLSQQVKSLINELPPKS